MDPIEVFGVGPDGELMPIESLAQRRRQGQHQTHGQADRVWSGMTLNDDGPEASTSSGHRGRRGQLPGGYDDRKSRSGGREDVMAPVPVLPGVASHALHSGELFQRPIPGMTVDVESLEVDARGSSWKAVVDCGRLRPRPATLRAYPSPSLNLTILELVPTRPRLIHTRAFVKAGVGAVATISRRLTVADPQARSAAKTVGGGAVDDRTISSGATI